MSEYLTEEQKTTLRGLDSKGFHLNTGRPCSCGPEEYSTRRRREFSDSLVFHHKCGECGNVFETWIEG